MEPEASGPQPTAGSTPYIFEIGETELNRQVGISSRLAEHVEDGLRRLGVKAGDKVIDVGCGPLGALPTLAQLVGPSGTVVGLDRDERGLARARQLLDRMGLAYVQLVHADVNEVDPANLCPPGPFDVAFCRHFLIHQPNPARTLRRIAAIVRPGGYIVDHEPLWVPELPPSDPALPALNTFWAWMGETMRRQGASPNIPPRFRALCAEAGLHPLRQRGWFNAYMGDAAEPIRIFEQALAGMRTAIVEHGVATEDQVAEALRQLREAEEWDFEQVITTLLIEMAARVP